MTRITFIIPRDLINTQPFKNTPLVAPYLLTILEHEFGDRVKLNINDLRGVDVESEIYHITESDMYLYSVYTPFMEEITGVVDKMREVFPKAVHVAGGPHINCFPEESEKYFDSVVLDDGEISIVSVVNDFIKSQLKPVYRQFGGIEYSGYPIADRKYLTTGAVVDAGVMRGKNAELRGASAIFSRGCPFKCVFCANHQYGAVYYRTAAQVLEEIEYLKKEYKIEALALRDDNGIPVNKKIVIPFLEAMGKSNIIWRGQTRTNGVRSEWVKLAKEAGCVDLAMGVESASQKVLDIVDKKTNLIETKEYLRLLKKTGIGVRMHIIMGLPGESKNVVKETLDFVDETNPDSVLLLLLCPMPGTPIYETPERFGIKLKSTGWQHFQMLFGRQDENELPSLSFEYEKDTPWGKSLSNQEILSNYTELQGIFRERNLNF